MEPLFYYQTVSEAIAELAKQGYTTDFNLEENSLRYSSGILEPHQFEIVKVYRYEGNTDPADEAVVYAIRSESGLKGILVTGYGAVMDAISPSLLEKLRYVPG